MSTMPGVVSPQEDTTPPARSEETLRSVKRAQSELDKARRRVDALLVTRDAAIEVAQADGWTSRELADACGMKSHNIRQMTYRRRKDSDS